MTQDLIIDKAKRCVELSLDSTFEFNTIGKEELSVVWVSHIPGIENWEVFLSTDAPLLRDEEGEQLYFQVTYDSALEKTKVIRYSASQPHTVSDRFLKLSS